MNDAKKQRIAERQRRAVADMPGGEVRPPAPQPPVDSRSLDDIYRAERERYADKGFVHVMPVAYLRFNDKTFQVVGSQSGEELRSKKEPNENEHRIELVDLAGTQAFLVGYIKAGKRTAEFDVVPAAAVKTWRPAL